MDASFGHHSPLRSIVLGRFTRVSMQTPAGEIEARLSEPANWELRVRRDQEMNWRLPCTGDLDCGIVTTQPVAAAQEEASPSGHSWSIRQGVGRPSGGGAQALDQLS
jgi:hypothetical protein